MNDKMIEEMAFDLIKATSPLGVKDLTEVFNYKKVATDLCNLLNWRKIPEGAVVLTKEEYAEYVELRNSEVGELVKENRELGKQCLDWMKLYHKQLTKTNEARKETTKEILQDLYHAEYELTIEMTESSKQDVETVMKALALCQNNKIKELAEKYGVKVEE